MEERGTGGTVLSHGTRRRCRQHAIMTSTTKRTHCTGRTAPHHTTPRRIAWIAASRSSRGISDWLGRVQKRPLPWDHGPPSAPASCSCVPPPLWHRAQKAPKACGGQDEWQMYDVVLRQPSIWRGCGGGPQHSAWFAMSLRSSEAWCTQHAKTAKTGRHRWPAVIRGQPVPCTVPASTVGGCYCSWQ